MAQIFPIKYRKSFQRVLTEQKKGYTILNVLLEELWNIEKELLTINLI